ncbi:MAG: glycosyltransferase family 4 protein [Bacteroidaceae bacterium]|nr:glycosyltransferase family 4 protein [Bacteroidaceae bacterium]
MKILYNIAGTCHSGGMERVLANKANWLVANGYDVVIVTTDQRGEPPFFALDERIKCHDLGVNYEENNGAGFLNKLLKYPAKQRKHKRLLREVLAEECPDITVSMFCNDVSFIAGLKEGGKKVLEIHFGKHKRLQYGRKGLWRLADLWRTRQDERLVRRFDRFVVLTNEDKELWGDIPGMVVIPNAKTFTPLAHAALDNKRVIAVGRYTHQKGFERLIEAWRLICDKVPGWSLDIIGDGEQRVVLQELVDTYGLGNSVTLVPPTNDMPAVYMNASVVAMSSRYEGLPMILVEAQAFGLPIVSFDSQCGPADVVEDSVTGFLVPEGDVHALAHRLECVMCNDKLRKDMGAAACKASERYSVGKVMGQWCELFNSVVKE